MDKTLKNKTNILEGNLPLNTSVQTLLKENSKIQCDICDYETTTERGLMIHKKKIHTKTIEKEKENYSL